MAITSRPTRLLQFFFGMAIIATIATLGIKLYSLHEHAHIRYDPRQEVRWLAPNSSDTERKNIVISNTRWRHNYSDIERVLWEAQDIGNKSGAPLMLLARINSLLPENLADDELQHLTSLVERSLIDDHAKIYARWIVNYYNYMKTDQQLKSAINRAPDAQRMAQIRGYLVDLNRRQEEHFGTNASFLFEQQNSQTHYFYQRRLVRLNNSLNEQQKKAALDAIKLDYQRELETLRSESHND